jgi:hypothetical protein
MCSLLLFLLGGNCSTERVLHPVLCMVSARLNMVCIPGTFEHEICCCRGDLGLGRIKKR